MDNRATTTGGTLRRLVAALVIATGVAIAWGVVVGWGASIVEGWLRGDTYVYENLVVRRDGTPAIQTYSSRDYEDISYRTIDGQPLEMKNNEQLDSAYLYEPNRPPRFFDMPFGWGNSWGLSDYARPRNSWYVIRRNDTADRAYIAGFNVASNMPVGYIGRSGFRRSLPPEDEWFDMRGFGRTRSEVASNGYAAYNAPANQYTYSDESVDMRYWQLYLIDGNSVVEVDLRERTVRRIAEAPNIVSLGIVAIPLVAQANEKSSEIKVARRLAVRTIDRVIVVDPSSDWRQEFLLPESLRDSMLTAFLLSNDQLLATRTPDRKKYYIQQLLWLSPDGTVVRDETATLAERPSIDISERQAATLGVGLVPVPVAWAGITAVAPVAMVNANESPTYAAAMKKFLGVCAPALVIVTSVGAVCAWIVRRWQRRYFRPATPWWCAFAFLLGVPGLIAYWLEHHRAKLEECRECHAIAPRDRDVCAACDTLFPAPPLVGTEVFA